jgi:alpha-tubulin suppressor-like RCC1 family protein
MFISRKLSRALGKGSAVRGFGLKSLSLTMLASKATTTLTASPGFHSAFIKSDGSLWSMGENGGGQLGINSFES